MRSVRFVKGRELYTQGSAQKGLHPDAAEYYYDFISRGKPGVPDGISRHIRRCLLCQAQICRLKEIVVETTRGEADTQWDRMDRDVIERLNLHFRCLGEPVTCSRAKPFLPGLLIPSLKIRIPTPITVHVDHCPECAEDLSVLRGLGLDPGQLERLERLYAKGNEADPSLCGRAQLKIPAFAAGSFGDIDDEFLDHLCTCRQCRRLVYQHREKVLEGQPAQGVDAPACRTSMADVFDCVIARDAGDEAGPAGSHVRTCRRCLEAVQALHRAVYSIADRGNSGVITVYTTTEEEKETPAAEDPYPMYPIHVQVIDGRSTLATRPSWPAATVAALSHTATNPRLKPWLKAAVILFAAIPLTLLFLHTRTSSGISLGQMFKAFGRAENVRVSWFYPPTGELLQEVWISRARDIVLVIEGQERAFYDLGAKKKYVYSTPETAADIAELSDRQYTNARRLMDGSLGFTLRDVPADATWTRVDDGLAEGAEVYELAYTQQDPSGTVVLLKWTIIVDPLTRLPEEVLAFHRLPADDEWNTESGGVFEYPTESEITAVLGE